MRRSSMFAVLARFLTWFFIVRCVSSVTLRVMTDLRKHDIWSTNCKRIWHGYWRGQFLRGHNHCFCFVIIEFQFIVGHPLSSIVHEFLHGLYKFTNTMWWGRFSTACHQQMSSDESGDVQLDQKGVWYRGQTEQVPGQSPEEHRKKREQDQTLDRWWRQFEFCWTGMKGTVAVQ